MNLDTQHIRAEFDKMEEEIARQKEELKALNKRKQELEKALEALEHPSIECGTAIFDEVEDFEFVPDEASGWLKRSFVTRYRVRVKGLRAKGEKDPYITIGKNEDKQKLIDYLEVAAADLTDLFEKMKGGNNG